MLTTDELPKYDISYVGREQVDEISTYVFDVKPKKIEKNQRYFQGRVWVDDKDLEIVKTYGKAVPDIRKHGDETCFRVLRPIAKILKATIGSPPTPTRTICCTSARRRSHPYDGSLLRIQAVSGYVPAAMPRQDEEQNP